MSNITKEIHQYLLYVRYKYWNCKDARKVEFLNSLTIMSPLDTIDYIVEHKCNVSRYGDGEFYVMSGGCNGFQDKNKDLAKRLIEVLNKKSPNLLLCVPHSWLYSKDLVLSSKLFFEAFKYTTFNKGVMPYLNTNKSYGDSLFTRFYIRRKDKSKKRISNYIEQLKKIWDKKDILLVEGEHTRCGVGNDIFNNAKSVKRILCPSRNAFDKYDEILEAIRANTSSELVLLALGMTATVLASDLLDYNIWAIDLGHIDTEYTWYKMGVKDKVPIPGKYVNEVKQKDSFELSDDNDEYKKQIIKIVR